LATLEIKRCAGASAKGLHADALASPAAALRGRRPLKQVKQLLKYSEQS
jgi:hypothetical protein